MGGRVCAAKTDIGNGIIHFIVLVLAFVLVLETFRISEKRTKTRKRMRTKTRTMNDEADDEVNE
jgi:hypothetical protein